MKSDGSTVDTELSQKLLEISSKIIENYEYEMKEYKGSLGSFIMAKLVLYIDRTNNLEEA